MRERQHQDAREHRASLFDIWQRLQIVRMHKFCGWSVGHEERYENGVFYLSFLKNESQVLAVARSLLERTYRGFVAGQGGPIITDGGSSEVIFQIQCHVAGVPADHGGSKVTVLVKEVAPEQLPSQLERFLSLASDIHRDLGA